MGWRSWIFIWYCVFVEVGYFMFIFGFKVIVVFLVWLVYRGGFIFWGRCWGRKGFIRLGLYI